MDQEPQSPHQTPITALVAAIGEMGRTVQENTKATAAMSADFRRIYLVLLAMATMGCATWLLYKKCIGEWNWYSLALVCLSPFFGEGVGRALGRRPDGTVQKIATMAFLFVGVIVFFL